MIMKETRRVKHYLNNCAAGLPDRKMLSVVTRYLKKERRLGVLEAEIASSGQIQEFYENARRLINAESASEISFVDSTTRAWNLAFYGLNLKSGDEIVTLSSEFGTNLVTTYDYANRVSAKVRVVKCDETGDFSLEEFENYLKAGAKFITVTHVAAHGSIINPVEKIGKLAKRYGAMYLVDGCQSAGQIPVDVQKIGCDAYTVTGRKWLCGSRGTGFLYVRSSALSSINATQLGWMTSELAFDKKRNVVGVKVVDEAKKFELWEKNVASLLGFSYCIKKSISRNGKLGRIGESANKIRAVVVENPNLKLVGKAKSASGVVGFYLTSPKHEAAALERFKEAKMVISVVSNSAYPLHFPNGSVKKIFRLSPHFYTSDKTVDRACRVVSRL
jgi:selenocysteine lyase/cysteine desulfurase